MFIKLVFSSYYLLTIICICVTQSVAKQLPPNVIIIMADDMGWADVGYHSDHILTPNIDTLAADGVVLNNFYVQPLCNPSRGALLTGRHPMHFGFQHLMPLLPYMATGLPLHFKLLPQYLKQYSYATHIVGMVAILIILLFNY